MKRSEKYVELSQASMAKHVELMLEFQNGAVAFDYGNNIRQVAFNNGVKMLLTSQALYQLTLDHYSVKVKGHSALLR